ncbi:MAG TPA: hypothetical protein VGA06_00870 [Candidatus Paceibacterota bacterium]|jgi:Tfp pilus assembly protein PilO
MRLITPILFIIIVIGLFLGFIDPRYETVKALRVEEQRYDEALTKSRELQLVRDQLLAKYNAFESEDLTRLQKLLPDHVDNVRLVLDLDGIAGKYNMRARNVAISRDGGQVPGEIDVGGNIYNSFLLSFAVTTSYENFLLFIQDLETSLRLVDVVNISFSESITNEYEFEVNVRTYWLE